MKKILVTGGCGFIGSAFIKYILKNTDYNILNVDKITYAARPESLDEINANPEYRKRYKLVKIDICDFMALMELFKNVDYVIHFAAETHVDRSIGTWEGKQAEKKRWGKQDEVFINTNIIGTQALLELTRKNMFTTKTMLEAMKAMVYVKKFIHISTDEVYGPTDDPCSENSMFNPRNPYSATKAGAEALVNAYFHTFEVPVCITRSCNNYGLWQGTEKFIPVAILSALANKSIPVYGSGKNVRDWIFVEDNVKAIFAVMEKGKIGEAYNIPAGIMKTNIEIAKTILKIIGKPDSLIKFVKDRPGHDFKYSMTGDKIKIDCNWAAEISLEEGLEKTIKFYKKHEKHFRQEQEQSGVLDRIKTLLEEE